MYENHYLVPAREQGDLKDVACSITAPDTDEAEYAFVDAKDRLLDINSWNKYCPAIGIGFRLTDSHGIGVGRHARKGDLMRMQRLNSDINKPEGFDWAVIEAIEYDDYPDVSMEVFAIRLKTAANPLNKEVQEDNDATATFVIERRQSKLYAAYHGRNAADGEEGATNEEWMSLVRCFFGILVVLR
jgi:hypothetical protein